MNTKLKLLVVFLMLLLGGFLRIYNLSFSPPSLNWDEVAWGYNAFSIGQTLKDEYGKTMPIFTRSFDEYKSTLPLYLMIPTIKIFGLNEVGVRLPSALLGTISILLIYLLVLEIFRNEKIAILSSFVYSIEPWAVHFSRVYHDANIATFFLLLGLLLFLKSKIEQKYLLFSVIFFMLSMYTYNSNKILVPLFMTMLYFLNKKIINSYSLKYLKYSLIAILFFLIPFIYLAFKGQTFARITSTNIFILWPHTGVLKELISGHQPNYFMSILLHNNYYYFFWEIIGRYTSYFSPYNLFIREPVEPATIITGNSIFYSFEFVPWVLGIIFLLTNYKKYKEFFFLLLISPLPAIATWNWFQPGRTMALFASFSILVGIGLVKLIEVLPKFTTKVAYLFLTFYLLFNAFYLFNTINVLSPYIDSGNWQPGFRETVPEVMKLADNYDQIIIDTPQAQPYIFYLFYGKYSPQKYFTEVDYNYIGTPRKHFDFGKFKFRNINWFFDKNLKNVLLVGDETKLPQVDIDNTSNAKTLSEIRDKYGNLINKLVSLE